MSWFSNISIRYKISFISLIGLLGFLAFQLINYRLSVFTTEELREIERADFPVLEQINSTHIYFMDMGRLYESAVAEGDLEIVDQAKQLSEVIVNELTQIKVLMPSYESDIDALLDTFSYYSTSVHLNAINFIQSENDVDSLSDNAMFESLSHVRVLRERFDREQRDFRDRLNTEFAEKLAKLQEQSQATVSQGLILGALLIISLFIASFSIIRQITNALGNAVSIADQVANGSLSSKIESNSNDETGLLIRSLAIMRDSLKSQKEEDQVRAANQQRVTKLNERMRGDKTLEELGSSVLNYLAPSFGAAVGAFWVLDRSTGTLEKVSGYALSQSNKTSNTCALGEGLVGQVAQLGETYHSSAVPSSYLSIESGVGSSDVGSLLIVPFQHEGVVTGVIELAAFVDFHENDIDFIRTYNTGIAIAVSSSQSRLQMANILQKTQLQAQELEKQGVALQTKSEQLELSGRYKSQFLSTMSHELRTPLNSILILSKGLLENKHQNLLPKQQEHAKVIYAAGSDLLTLINDILDLSKVEEGKLDLIIDEIDVKEFSRIIYHQFEYEAESKELDFEVTVADKLPTYFYADIHRLSQILRNFLSNALKFTKQGFVGLSIESSVLGENSSRAGEAAIAFKVTDSGIGISKDKYDHIFEAFQQADGTTSREFGGTGLGLTISRELSELMNGYITVSSQGEEQGSVFTLVLPVDNRDENSIGVASGTILPARDRQSKVQLLNTSSGESHPQEIQIKTGDTYRILLVEDDHLQVEAIEKICTNQNLILDTATTAKQARELLQTQEYDCLILDLHLPDGNSIGILREVRNAEAQSCENNNEPNDRLFTIVYTAETVSRDTEAELQAIADRIIIKTQRSLEWLSNEIQQFFMFELGDRELSSNTALNENGTNETTQLTLLNEAPISDSNESIELDNAEVSVEKSQALISTSLERDESKKNVAKLRFTTNSSAKLSNTDPSTVQTNHPNKHTLRGKSVLIVDDDVRNIYSLSAAFEDFDMSIYTAQNGEEAISFLSDRINNNQVDIVLMDIMMPVLNGLDATKRIREIPELTSIPIIALTAKVMADDKLNCLLAGTNGYLAKPVDIPELEKQLLSFIG